MLGEPLGQGGAGGFIPTGVDSPQAIQFQPERQSPQPVKCGTQLSRIQLPQRRLMLAGGPIVVFTQMTTGTFRMGGVVTQCVEFVIAEDCQRISFFDHRSGNVQNLLDLGTAINQVAQKNHLPFGVREDTLAPFVPELFQQQNQLGGMAVNVADQVVHGGRAGDAPEDAGRGQGNMADSRVLEPDSPAHHRERVLENALLLRPTPTNRRNPQAGETLVAAPPSG